MTLTRFCQSLQRAPSNVSLVLGLDLSEKLPSPCTDQAKNNMLHSIPTRLFVNSSAPGFMESNSWYPSTKPKGRKAWKLLKRVLRLLHRQAEDELIQALLLLMNQHVIPLKAVEMQMPNPNPVSLARTGIFCGFHTAACMLQPQCILTAFSRESKDRTKSICDSSASVRESLNIVNSRELLSASLRLSGFVLHCSMPSRRPDLRLPLPAEASLS